MRTLILAALLATGCGDTIIDFDTQSPLDGHWRGEVLQLDNRKDTLDIWIDYSGMSNWDGTGQYEIHLPGQKFGLEVYAYLDGAPEDFALTVVGSGTTFGYSGRLQSDALLIRWRGTEDNNTYRLERQ